MATAMEAITAAGAAGWFNNFALHKETCIRRLEQFLESKEDECPVWKDGDSGGPSVERQGRGKFDPQDYKDWPLVDQIWDPIAENKWPPANTKLNDYWFYMVAKFLTAKERMQNYSYDFDRDGHARSARVPRGEPVTVEAHGFLWIPVLKGNYALTGATFRHQGWLLNGQTVAKENGISPTQFVIGLICVPDDTKGFSRHVQYPDDIPLMKSKTPAKTWIKEERRRGLWDLWGTFDSDQIMQFSEQSCTPIISRDLKGRKTIDRDRHGNTHLIEDRPTGMTTRSKGKRALQTQGEDEGKKDSKSRRQGASDSGTVTTEPTPKATPEPEGSEKRRAINPFSNLFVSKTEESVLRSRLDEQEKRLKELRDLLKDQEAKHQQREVELRTAFERKEEDLLRRLRFQEAEIRSKIIHEMNMRAEAQSRMEQHSVNMLRMNKDGRRRVAMSLLKRANMAVQQALHELDVRNDIVPPVSTMPSEEPGPECEHAICPAFCPTRRLIFKLAPRCLPTVKKRFLVTGRIGSRTEWRGARMDKRNGALIHERKHMFCWPRSPDELKQVLAYRAECRERLHAFLDRRITPLSKMTTELYSEGGKEWEVFILITIPGPFDFGKGDMF